MEGKGYLVQIIVLSDELLELGLDVDDLGCWELELDDRHTGFFQMFQEPDFGGLQEHQAASLAFFATGCTADSVDVVSGVIRGVELDDPVHRGDLNCQYNILKSRKGKGNIHPILLLQHRYRSRFLVERYRIRKRCWSASAASAAHATPAPADQCS